MSSCEMPAKTYIHDLGGQFAQVAARNGARPAIRPASGPDVTYTEFDALSNRLARWLLASGVGPGGVVAIESNKTPASYALMIACLRIGAAYTHLDRQNPSERIARILGVSRPRLIVCDETPSGTVVNAAARSNIEVASLIDRWPAIEILDFGPLLDRSRVTSADPAYIMFTSGSTGVPKGVAISHGSVLNFIAWTRTTFGIGGDDVVANANPLYFDNSVFDFYSALFSGACLAPITSAELREPRAAVRRVDEARCTVWFSVPSLLIYLMTMKALQATDSFRHVRTLIFGGEGYPKGELSKLYALFGGRCHLYNVYGPTECTCICSAFQISTDDLAGPELAPLGRIAQNFSYLVLDGGRPVPPGEGRRLCA